MLYRIDLEHFLLHMIDHFTREELTHMEYAIISSRITSGKRRQNVQRLNHLYPPMEITIDYSEHHDFDLFQKQMFKVFDELQETDPAFFYKCTINPLAQHVDVLYICRESENDYVTAFVNYLKEKFDIEVVDLNELFTKGHVGPIYLDHKKIWNKAVDIRRRAGEETIAGYESTADGRLYLMGKMTKKQKVKKLKELGVQVNGYDDIDQLLMEVWVSGGEGK